MSERERPEWVLGCGQPKWHHDPFYCGPECQEWIDPDDDNDAAAGTTQQEKR